MTKTEATRALALWIRRRFSWPRVRELLRDVGSSAQPEGEGRWAEAARLTLSFSALWGFLGERDFDSSFRKIQADFLAAHGWKPCPAGIHGIRCCGDLRWRAPVLLHDQEGIFLVGTLRGGILEVYGERPGGPVGRISGSVAQLAALLPWLAPDLRLALEDLLVKAQLVDELPEDGDLRDRGIL